MENMKREIIFNKIIKNIKTLFYYIVSGKPCKKNKTNDAQETGFSGKLSEKLSNKWWWKVKFKKKKTYTNNPLLRKLMETPMTFKELKEKEFILLEKRQNLIAKQSAIRYSKMLINKDFDYVEIDKLSDEIYQINDLLNGISTKIRDVGFEYELLIEKALPKSTGGEEIWVYTKTIITEKKYSENLDVDDLIELMILSGTIEGETVKRVRLVGKK